MIRVTNSSGLGGSTTTSTRLVLRTGSSSGTASQTAARLVQSMRTASGAGYGTSTVEGFRKLYISVTAGSVVVAGKARQLVASGVQGNLTVGGSKLEVTTVGDGLVLVGE